MGILTGRSSISWHSLTSINPQVNMHARAIFHELSKVTVYLLMALQFTDLLTILTDTNRYLEFIALEFIY